MLIPDVAYLGDDRQERMDIYRPDDATGPRPAVVIIHGGGWRIGDKADARERGIAETLTAAGYVCASINYLLAVSDRPSWPTCIEDCRAAVRYLRLHAADYGIAPARMGVIGGSAGGCLSLLLGQPDPAKVSARVQAIVALYPPTDMLTWGDRIHLLGVSKAQRPDLHRAASPLHQLTADFPPTLLIHGTADKTVTHLQSEALAAAMKKMGLPHELILIEGAPHTFKLQEAAFDLRSTVTNFFDKHLRG